MSLLWESIGSSDLGEINFREKDTWLISQSSITKNNVFTGCDSKNIWRQIIYFRNVTSYDPYVNNITFSITNIVIINLSQFSGNNKTTKTALIINVRKRCKPLLQSLSHVKHMYSTNKYDELWPIWNIVDCWLVYMYCLKGVNKINVFFSHSCFSAIRFFFCFFNK